MKDQFDPPPLKAKHSIPETVGKLVIRPGDSVLVIRADESVEVFPYIKPGKRLGLPAITALGLYWLMDNDEWMNKLQLRAVGKIKEIMAGSPRSK